MEPSSTTTGSTVRVAIIPTEAGYRVRPAVALAYVGDTIRVLNLTNKKVTLKFPNELQVKGSAQVSETEILADLSEEVVFCPPPATPAGQRHPRNHGKRWRIHYSAFLENGSPIPGESSPEIIIDEQP